MKFREMGKSDRTSIRSSDTDVIVLSSLQQTGDTYKRVLGADVKNGGGFLPIHQLHVCACFSPAICKLLPAVHTLSGCNTTSSLFGVGKKSVYKTLKDTHDYFSCRASEVLTKMKPLIV